MPDRRSGRIFRHGATIIPARPIRWMRGPATCSGGSQLSWARKLPFRLTGLGFRFSNGPCGPKNWIRHRWACLCTRNMGSGMPIAEHCCFIRSFNCPIRLRAGIPAMIARASLACLPVRSTLFTKVATTSGLAAVILRPRQVETVWKPAARREMRALSGWNTPIPPHKCGSTWIPSQRGDCRMAIVRRVGCVVHVSAYRRRLKRSCYAAARWFPRWPQGSGEGRSRGCREPFASPQDAGTRCRSNRR